MNHLDGRAAGYDITNFTIREMSRCGNVLRGIGAGAGSMEEAAERIVRHLYDNLIEGQSGRSACSLVRFFKTHPYRGLDGEQQEFARGMLTDGSLLPDTKCLTLLATAGEREEWDSRKSSRGHQAIPLPSEEVVRQNPMIQNLIMQVGIPVKMVVEPDPRLLMGAEQRTYSVFHVPEACGSPFIPAQQDFVVPCGIRSVLGFGGLLPNGDMFAVILFFKVPVPAETAHIFKALSLNVKMAVLPFDHLVFSSSEGGSPVPAGVDAAEPDVRELRSGIAALEQLIEVYENSVVDQADKLYGEIAERRRAEEDAQQLNAVLEQRVEEGTRELVEAQEELVRNEKLAILGQLSGSVGHELRNPLGVMSNAVYFLKMVTDNSDETVKEYLGIIENEIRNSQRIITDLLDFARTKQPQRHSTAAAELVRQGLAQCTIPEGVRVTVDAPEDLPRLNVDPLQVSQVLMNFVSNAVQAMPNGGVLRVAARRVLSSELRVLSSNLGSNSELKTKNSKLDGDFVEISVADTGEGIPAENMKKLFLPLFTTKPRGIGLGLLSARTWRRRTAERSQ